MFQHTLIQSVQTPSGQLNAGNKVYQGAANIELDEEIAAGGTDIPVNVNFGVGNIKSLVITSDRDILLETNNATTPGNTLNLKANVPYIWNIDSYDINKINVAVTALFFTNVGTAVANISLRIVYDPTP